MFKTQNLNFKNFISYDDIHIKKSKINFITGESGSGKSTLLKLFNRTENYSNGIIYYKDNPIDTIDSILLRNEVKLISQTPFLFQASIKENFNLFYQYCEKPNISDSEMKYFLDLTLANFPLDTLCDILSGGEKQRVYIAICLSIKSETIMLDEPTSALDFQLAQKVLSNIISYIKSNNKTLVIISHDSKLTEIFAENLIELKGGKKHD